LIIFCAYDSRILPASVSVPDLLLRSNSASPSSSSKRLMAMLIAGWVRCIRSAAREKLFSSAMARKISSCAKSKPRSSLGCNSRRSAHPTTIGLPYP
jgi:hypothetical protein